MKCHYIYTEDGLKVLIPGCMGTAVRGIEHCTCRDMTSHAEFERERYNETVKALRSEVKEMKDERDYLNRIIRNLTKHKWHDPEELPQEEMLVLCKVDGCEYTRYLVMHRHCGDWWSYRACMDDEDEDGWYRFNKRVVGWRLIHE